MAFENLISVQFSDAELAQLDTALSTIAQVLQGKTVNLTPEQRQQYGSIAEQNKLFVNKAKNYMEQYPEHVPGFLDKAEFDRDFSARTQIEQRLQRLANLTEQLGDTKILLDHDNWYNALTFYRNIKFLSGEDAPGTTTIYRDMKQFFVAGNSPVGGQQDARGVSEPDAPKP